MNKQELKKLIIDNFNSEELYEIISEVKRKPIEELDKKVESLYVQAKNKFKIGMYIETTSQYIQGLRGVDFGKLCNILSNKESDCKLYIKITNIELNKSNDNCLKWCITLYYDYVYIDLSIEKEQEEYTCFTNNVFLQMGNSDFCLLKYYYEDNNYSFKLYEFDFNEITEKEYEDKIKLFNNLKSQIKL